MASGLETPGGNPVGIFTNVVRDVLVVEVDETLYSLQALFRTCYTFTDQAYVYLCRERAGIVEVHLSLKGSGLGDLRALAGEFCNQLLDYQLRAMVSAETGKIRELIVAQAFSEGNLLDDPADGKQDEADPLKIGDYRDHRGQ